MNNADKVYQDLLRDILENGVRKSDRTGTGTISVFGRQIRFNMREGFPLLTTKKMFTKGIVHELIWFLRGDTNIKYLVDNGVNIWNGDAYRGYKNRVQFSSNPHDRHHTKLGDNEFEIGDKFTEEEFVEKIKTDERFAKEWGDLGPVYGKQWVNWGERGNPYSKYNDYNEGVNQIQNVIDMLNNNPDSRRIMVNAWNVADLNDMILPPCHYGFQLYTRELNDIERLEYFAKHWFTEDEIVPSNTSHETMDKEGVPKRAISLAWNQRSVDVGLGLPFNIASYALLLHMFAQQVNMVPEELVGNLGDTHIYTNHLEQVNTQLTRNPKKLCTLALSKADDIFSYCYEDVKFEGYESHPRIKAKLST